MCIRIVKALSYFVGKRFPAFRDIYEINISLGRVDLSNCSRIIRSIKVCRYEMEKNRAEFTYIYFQFSLSVHLALAQRVQLNLEKTLTYNYTLLNARARTG